MDSACIVVLNYKGISDTVKCIASLSKQTYENFTIVAIENGSMDGSVDEFKKLEKQYGTKLVTIYNQRNLGFDGGVNTGIRWAIEHNYDYVALFNNDATADADWLKNLVKVAKIEDAGITTGLLLLRDGTTIDSTGDWYSKWGLPFPRNRNDPAAKAPDSGPVFSGSGGASLFSITMLNEIGLFDEDFFAYYEDNDIGFRAQLAGWGVHYTKDAVAYHNQGSTANRMASGFAIYQTFKNLPMVFIKNVPFGLLLTVGVRFYFAYVLMFSNAIRHGAGIAALRGVVMGGLLSIKKLPTRWRIQRNKKVSTSRIKEILWDDLPPDQTGLRKLRKAVTGK